MIHEAPELLPTHYYEHQLSQQQQRTDAKVNRVFWMTECWINTFLLHYMQKDAKIWRQEKSCVQTASATVGGDPRSPPQFLLWLQIKEEEEEEKKEEFASEQLQVNPNKHSVRWRSKHSATIPEQTLGVPKSLAWHVMTRKWILSLPASFPWCGMAFRRPWETPHLPRHHHLFLAKSHPAFLWVLYFIFYFFLF